MKEIIMEKVNPIIQDYLKMKPSLPTIKALVNLCNKTKIEGVEFYYEDNFLDAKTEETHFFARYKNQENYNVRMRITIGSWMLNRGDKNDESSSQV